MEFASLRVLAYKMTHPGDPQPNSGERFTAPAWGRQDCMGEVRDRDYDAVIGVGGIGREPASHDMAGKLQWIGIGPRRWPGGPHHRGSILTFDRYLWFGANGPAFLELAPNLAQRMLGENAREVMNFTPEEQKEVSRILALARNAGPCHPASGGPPEVPVLGAVEQPCGCDRRDGGTVDDNRWIKNLDDFIKSKGEPGTDELFPPKATQEELEAGFIEGAIKNPTGHYAFAPTHIRAVYRQLRPDRWAVKAQTPSPHRMVTYAIWNEAMRPVDREAVSMSELRRRFGLA